MKRLLLLAGVLVVLVGGAAGYWFYRSLGQPYRAFTDAEVFVEIPSGSGTASMGQRLTDAGVVPSSTAFRAAVWMRKAGRRLQAGEYRFDRPATPMEVVDRIARGDVYLRSITFREGLTIRQMAAIFEEKGFGPADAFLKAASSSDRIRALDPRGPRSRGVSLSGHVRAATARDGGNARGSDGRRVREGALAGSPGARRRREACP